MGSRWHLRVWLRWYFRECWYLLGWHWHFSSQQLPNQNHFRSKLQSKKCLSEISLSHTIHRCSKTWLYWIQRSSLEFKKPLPTFYLHLNLDYNCKWCWLLQIKQCRYCWIWFAAVVCERQCRVLRNEHMPAAMLE